jgi:hypothetical protein
MGSNKPPFDVQLRWAEQHLDRLLHYVGSDDGPWCRKRAREGIERARAELKSVRDDLWWRDEDLPF